MALSLMMDASGSMALQQPKVRRSAELLMEEFGRGDRVNIGAFQGLVMVTQRFTANRGRILKSLEQPVGAFRSSKFELRTSYFELIS